MNKESRKFIQKIIDEKKHDGFDVETLVRSRETIYFLGIPCTVDTLSVISKKILKSIILKNLLAIMDKWMGFMNLYVIVYSR